MKKMIRTALLLLVPAFAGVAGAYPADPPDDGLGGTSQSITIIAPKVSTNPWCSICKP